MDLRFLKCFSSDHIEQPNPNGPKVQDFDLNEEEYCLFLLYSLFNVYYLPWLKDIAPQQYKQNYMERFQSMSQSLEPAFPSIKHESRGKLINSLAQKYCFQFKRRLFLLIDSVSYDEQPTDDCDEDNDDEYSVFNDRTLWLIMKDVNGEVCDVCEPFKIENDYSMYIDIPTKLNDSMKDVDIEVYSQMQPKSLFFYIKDFEISGYAGFNQMLSLNGSVHFRLNLRWELNSEKLVNRIQRPDIFLHFFSGSLLALGTYFYRFYSALYSELLSRQSTQNQALKCFNEVAFLIGSTQRARLCPQILEICQQYDNEHFSCNLSRCNDIYRLAHAVIILLESCQSERSEMVELCEKLQKKPLDHILQFKCWTILCGQLDLHKLLLRRLFQILKKQNSIINHDCFKNLMLNLLIDTTKNNLSPLQKMVIILFVRFFKMILMKKYEDYGDYYDDKEADEGEEEEDDDEEEEESSGKEDAGYSSQKQLADYDDGAPTDASSLSDMAKMERNTRNNQQQSQLEKKPLKLETSRVDNLKLIVERLLLKFFPNMWTMAEMSPEQDASQRLLRRLARQFSKQKMSTAIQKIVDDDIDIFA